MLCLAVGLIAPAARADLPRPDVSCDTKGAACDNAAPNGVGTGVCTSGVEVGQFGRPSCEAAGAAGAAGSGQTECLFCQASQGTAGGNGTAGGSSAPGATSSGDDSGCSVRQLGSERGIGTFMLGLGLAALAISRRRR